MLRKIVTFIGNQKAASDGRHSVEAYGNVFVLRQPKIVMLTANAVTKLEGNSHFTVEDVPLQSEDPAAVLDRIASDIGIKLNAEATKADPVFENVETSPVTTPEAAKAPEEDAAIEVRRERPRQRAR